MPRGYDEHAAWPVFVEPYLWFSGPFRSGSKLVRLSGGDSAAAVPVWESRLLSNDVFSSVCHEGMLYGFDLKDVQAKAHRPSRGQFRCLDLLTGEARWETDRVGHASVLVADDKLILLNDQGELILARASPERYVELSRAAVLAGEICWTPPALDRGRIYVRNQSHAACIFIGSPDLLESGQAGNLLTVADIPQGKYHDLAAILGVEPEYAFDVPSERWLRNWFWTGLVLMAVAAVVAVAIKYGWRIALRRQLSERAAWGWFWLVAFVLGALGTTSLSLLHAEFVFTWPVSLFVVFEATIRQVGFSRDVDRPPAPGWRSRLVALGFVGICAAYYVLCRRLSLVFEWVFLSGFGAAIPVVIADRWLARRAPRWFRMAPIATAIEFAAYYWGSVVWLWWKYPAT